MDDQDRSPAIIERGYINVHDLARMFPHQFLEWAITEDPALPDSVFAAQYGVDDDTVRKYREIAGWKAILKGKTATQKKSSQKKKKESINAALRWKVFERDNYTCQWCGAKGVPLEADHIIAESLGGETVDYNLQSLCEPSNRKKGTGIMSCTVPERLNA